MYKFKQGTSCTACAPQCMRCSGTTASNCSKCAPTYYHDGKTCGASCLEHPDYFMSDFYLTCDLVCSPTLYTVADLKKCVTQCPLTYFRQGQYCLLACPSGFYAEVSNKTCQPCSSECLTCTGSTRDNCITCSASYYL